MHCSTLRPKSLPLAALLCLAMAAADAPARAQQPAAPEDRPIVQQAYQASQAAETAEELTAVIDLCQRALDAGPSEKDSAYARQLMSWAHNRRGGLAAEQGQAEEALADFEQSVALDATRWQAVHNRGVSYAMAGRFEEAQADFDRTIELEPRYAHAWFNRGELHYQRGELESAIEDYDESLRLKPDDVPALSSRGHAHRGLGHYAQALADLSRAVRLDPRAAAARVYRAETLADMGRFEQAANDYRSALSADPRYGRGYQSAAWFLATCPDGRFRDGESAVRAATRAIELDGDSQYQYLDTLAAAHAAAGDFELAQSTQTQAIERAADEPPEQLQGLVSRLELYQQRRSYVQPALRAAPPRQSASSQ